MGKTSKTRFKALLGGLLTPDVEYRMVTLFERAETAQQTAHVSAEFRDGLLLLLMALDKSMSERADKAASEAAKTASKLAYADKMDVMSQRKAGRPRSTGFDADTQAALDRYAAMDAAERRALLERRAAADTLNRSKGE